MNHLSVNEIKENPIFPQGLHDAFSGVSFHELNTINWPEYPYRPEVTFSMIWSTDHLYLMFKVKEQHARAVTDYPNGPVWEDSCCEFFCSFDDKGYYNLETNCIGTHLLGFTAPGKEQVRGDEKVMGQLRSWSSLGNKAPLSLEGEIEWELLVSVPASAFFMHQGLEFKKGMQFRANFYKCGDKCKTPHFLSWRPIQAPQPNFHLPGFFGEVVLG